MSTALLTRTVVVGAYLVALLFQGRADLVTGLLAAAVAAVWTVSLMRDRMTRAATPGTFAAPASVAGTTKPR